MHNHKIYIILGLPGAGKGSLCQNYIEKNPDAYHFSLGELFRKEIAEQTKIGLFLIESQKKGLLAPLDFVNSFVFNKLDKLLEKKKLILLDGFPRNTEQAKAIEQYFVTNNISSTRILLDIEPNIAIDRIKYRKICISCSKIFNSKYISPEIICNYCGEVLQNRISDDLSQTLNRIKILDSHLSEIVTLYSNEYYLKTINANPEFKLVLKDFFSLLP